MVNRDGSVCAPDVARVLDRGDAGDVRVVLYRDCCGTMICVSRSVSDLRQSGWICRRR